MKSNVGGIDRTLRILVGAGLVTATAMGLLPVWGWVGILLIATGAIRFCPVYPLLKINTCKKTV